MDMLFGLGLIARVGRLRTYSWDGVGSAQLVCFWGRGYWLGYARWAGINSVDRTGGWHIYGRAWDSAQLVYFGGVGIVCTACIRWVEGLIVWIGRLEIAAFTGGCGIWRS